MPVNAYESVQLWRKDIYIYAVYCEEPSLTSAHSCWCLQRRSVLDNFTLSSDLSATELKPDLVSRKRCFETVGGTELSVVVERRSTA